MEMFHKHGKVPQAWRSFKVWQSSISIENFLMPGKVQKAWKISISWYGKVT